MPHFSLICTKVDTYTKAKTKIKPSDIIISHFQIIDNVHFFLFFLSFLHTKKLVQESLLHSITAFFLIFCSIFIIVPVLTSFFLSWQGNFLLHEAEKWLHEKIDNLSNLQQLAYKYTFCRAGWLQVGKWVNNGTFSHCTAIHNVPCVSCLSDTTDDTSLQLSRI